MKVLIRSFFKLVRAIIGPIMLLGDKLTSPKGIIRDAQTQKAIDEQTSSLSLYEFKTCPFCIKTRRAIKRLSLPIERHDAQHDPVRRQQLLKEGGQIKVPCLRIIHTNGNIEWMYESDRIIDYLQQRFDT
jgi:glutaredoxin